MYDDYSDYESDVAFDFNESEGREFPQDWETIEARYCDFNQIFTVVEPLDNLTLSW